MKSPNLLARSTLDLHTIKVYAVNNNHPQGSIGNLDEHAPGTLSAYDMKGNLQWQAQPGAYVGAGEDHVK